MNRFTTARNTGAGISAIGCLIWIALIVISGVGWITHVVHCIKTSDILFLLVGAIAAPIGVIHGWGLIFGWW